MPVLLSHIESFLLRLPLSLSLPLSFALLVGMMVMTTYPEHAKLQYLRLALAFPVCALWYAVAWPPGLDPGLGVGLYTLGCMFLMRTVDVACIGFIPKGEAAPRLIAIAKPDPERPYYVKRTQLGLPTTPKERVRYSADYIISIRGLSFYHNRIWDWAREHEVQAQYGQPPISHWHAVLRRLRWALQSYIQSDICTFLILQIWAKRGVKPLIDTDASILSQAAFVLLCGGVILGAMNTQYDAAAIIMSHLTWVSITDWPRLYQEPWRSRSIGEFWGIRWQPTLNRGFIRSTVPLTELMTRWIPPRHRFGRNFIRGFNVFLASSILHMGWNQALPRAKESGVSFFDLDTPIFFMLQVFGIAFELVVILPKTRNMGTKGAWLQRIWVWAWFAYTGRWFFRPFSKLLKLERRFSLLDIVYNRVRDVFGL